MTRFEVEGDGEIDKIRGRDSRAKANSRAIIEGEGELEGEGEGEFEGETYRTRRAASCPMGTTCNESVRRVTERKSSSLA